MSTIHIARTEVFARWAHHGQLYGARPYFEHVAEVAELCRPFGYEAETVAYLHDVLEDTAVSVEVMRAMFGADITALVELITDPPGPNRRERKRLLHQRLATTESKTALVVKLADRLANVRSCASSSVSPTLLRMYRREHADFRAAVWRPGLPTLAAVYWDELDRLLST